MQSRDDARATSVHPFVTISRQAGAGGHLLADALLEAFAQEDDTQLFAGWQVFDRRLCEIVAENPAYTESMAGLLAEEYRTRTHDFFHQILGSTVDQDLLMVHVFEVVRAAASIGKSIIVGRAGSEVTRGMGPGVAVRLVAPKDVCIAGVMRHYDLDEPAARDRARKLDESRARLLKSHFGVDINDPLRYDVVWNTGQVAIPAIARAIVAILRLEVAAFRSQAAQ